MFDKKDVEAYKKITAPTSLRDKVLASEKEYSTKKITYFKHKQIYQLAASIAILIGITSFWSWSKSSVSVYTPDEMVASATMDARSIEVSGVSIEVKTNHKRRVTVSQGTLWYVDQESGENVNSGTEIWVNDLNEFTWEVNPQTEGCQMKVTGWGKDQTFQLVYEQEDGTCKLKED